MTSTPDRGAQRRDFLSRSGLATTQPAALAGDASTRSYFRLTTPEGTPLILMDAPPAAESAVAAPDASPEVRRALGYNAMARLAACRVDAFAGVAAHLRTLGYSAPEVHALDVDRGFAVVEDLGDDLFATRLAAGADPAPLYTAAVDLLAELAAASAPSRLAFRVGDVAGEWGLPVYDALALQTGLDVFLDWWPAFAGRAAFDADARAGWAATWTPIVRRGEAGAMGFTHRDFHVENLVWLAERRGAARVGLLDFQDAVRGHPAWDLASLLQDARREVPEALEAAMLTRWLEVTAIRDVEGFRADYAGLAALNNLRIVGVFARLVARDGKARYAGFMPRMWSLVGRNLAHPALAGPRAWFAAHAPDAPPIPRFAPRS